MFFVCLNDAVIFYHFNFNIKLLSCVVDANERLTEENKKIHIQFLEQKQQLEELKDRLKFYSKVSFNEALALIKDKSLMVLTEVISSDQRENLHYVC